VTPSNPGTKTLQIKVTALLASMPGRTVFDTAYTVVVRVAPRSLNSRVGDFLKTGWGIVVSMAGGLAAIFGAILAFRKLKTRQKRKRQ
jgi:hypothetical protein